MSKSPISPKPAARKAAFAGTPSHEVDKPRASAAADLNEQCGPTEAHSLSMTAAAIDQAGLLRAGKANDIDPALCVELLDTVVQRELVAGMALLLTSLWRWRVQEDDRTALETLIEAQRLAISTALNANRAESPRLLAALVEDWLPLAWPIALGRLTAADLPPTQCPWESGDVLRIGWLPKAGVPDAAEAPAPVGLIPRGSLDKVLIAVTGSVSPDSVPGAAPGDGDNAQ